jgi:hypothetical protein
MMIILIINKYNNNKLKNNFKILKNNFKILKNK